LYPYRKAEGIELPKIGLVTDTRFCFSPYLGRYRFIGHPGQRSDGAGRRGLPAPSFSSAWALEDGGASCPARETPINRRFPSRGQWPSNEGSARRRDGEGVIASPVTGSFRN